MGGSSSKIAPYEHASRKMAYRTERLEITEDEREILARWIDGAAAFVAADTTDVAESSSDGPQKIIFDTDIGTDIDDALALLFLLHLPREDVQLLGITTVYGYTNLRAAIANKIMEGYDRARAEEDPHYTPPPVVTGEGVPLGTHRDLWHHGMEGLPVFDYEKDIKPLVEEWKATYGSCGKGGSRRKRSYPAAEFIVDAVRAHPGEVVILSLGAMTNIARALRIDPSIAAKIKRITYMGMGKRFKESQTDLFEFVPDEVEVKEPGRVYFHYPNHNISCDTLAAVEVFAASAECGIHIDVINDTVTNRVWFDGEPCAQLQRAASPPESHVVGEFLKAWLYYRSSVFYKDVTGTCPHDALTAAEAVYPGRFVEYIRGWLLIHRWAGFASFVVDPRGPHRIGQQVQREKFLASLGARVTQGLVEAKGDGEPARINEGTEDGTVIPEEKGKDTSEQGGDSSEGTGAIKEGEGVPCHADQESS